MALLGGLVGLAGGGFFGNLALLGLGIGIQIAVAYFFPQKIKGPRAENLRAQTSKFGDPLGRAYGSVKTAGACIWLKNNKVDEHVSKKRQGKGGPVVTTYSYTADFAVAFIWNDPITAITRMWADNHLIYDESADSLNNIISGDGSYLGKAGGMSVKIYLGTDNQQPDPDIEADLDAGNVPAWPGLVYVVFKNVPLDKIGIRVPNIEAEVVCAGTVATYSVNPIGDVAGSVDINGSRYVSQDANDTALVMCRVPDGVKLWEAVLPADSWSCHLTVRGDVAVPSADIGTLWIYDGLTGALVSTIDWGSGFNDPWQILADVNVDGETWLFQTTLTRLKAFRNSGAGWSYVWDGDLDTAVNNAPLTISAGPEFVYVIKQGGLGNPPVLRRVRWSATALIDNDDCDLTLAGNLVAAYYDGDSDSVVVVTTTHLYVLEPDLGAILRSRALGYAMDNDTSALASKRLTSATGHVMIKAGNNDFHEYRIVDLVETLSVDASATTWENKNSDYLGWGMAPNWGMALVYGADTPRYWFMPRISRAPVPLADVIAAECGLVDLAVDVTAIIKQIKGYAVREAMAPRGVIEDLQRSQFFDFAQRGGMTTFFNRDSTPIRTIAIEHMGMAESDARESPKLVSEEYADLRDLPAAVKISYPAFGADYRTGSQSIARPEGLDDTGQPLEFQTSLVMTDDEAAQAADIIFNETREAPSLYRTSLGPKYLELTPGDVVTLPLDETRAVGAVLVKMEGETMLDCELRQRRMEYTSDAVGAPTPGNGGGTMLGIAPEIFVPIDGHLLRANDDDDSFYCGVSRADAGSFESATVYRSTDGGDSYSPWGAFVNETTRGFALAALPNRPHPGSWDRASSLVIAVGNGLTPPASVSEETLLSDGTLNGFAVQRGAEWEYIRAASVIDNGNGTWTLSTLLRGQKGTEFAMAGHAAGNAVIYLDLRAMDRPPEGDKDLARIYAAIPVGKVFDTLHAVAFTNRSRGLRPWAPVDIAASRDGSSNLTVTANRRDRLGQEWPDDGPEDPPMSEASESYKLFVYDGSTVVRTIATSSLSFSYTAAQQTTDFGSPQASIDIGIVQVSATFGDGVEAAATV